MSTLAIGKTDLMLTATCFTESRYLERRTDGKGYPSICQWLSDDQGEYLLNFRILENYESDLAEIEFYSYNTKLSWKS